MKKYMKKTIVSIILIICCVTISACGNMQELGSNLDTLGSQIYEEIYSANQSSIEDSILWEQNSNLKKELEIHFLDVGQADCTVIRQGDYTMVIDAGTDNMGTRIQNYLQKLGIQKIDIFIVTHWDSDHCGSADVLVTKFDIGKMYISDFYKDTRTCEDVLKAMSYKNIAGIVPSPYDTDSLGQADIQFIAPCENYNDANNSSIGLLLTFENHKFLFAGDAEEKAEEEMLKLNADLTADVYKVSHHGSKTATTKEFLEAISPSYAVISVGEGNSYGMPHAAPLNELRALGVQVFRTDEEGIIICTSSGTDLYWNTASSESWQTGEEGVIPVEKTEAETATETETDSSYLGDVQKNERGEGSYVININTQKFHLPGCSSVGDMAEKNKETTDLLKDELLNQGYSPCGRCKP